ncbi:MAG: hypothetical protein ACOX8W_04855 [bacterium]|jgi:hypothetical protein
MLEIVVLKDRFYIRGTVRAVREQLREYLRQYRTVRELIDASFH